MAGIRPEHFEDASLVGDQRDLGATFTTEIDIIEWMGAELYAHFTVHGDTEVDLSDIADDLESVEMAGSGGAQVVARLDAGSRAAERQPLELWLDARRIHLFDAEDGANLQHNSPATGRVGVASSHGPGRRNGRQPRIDTSPRRPNVTQLDLSTGSAPTPSSAGARPDQAAQPVHQGGDVRGDDRAHW